MPPRTADPRSDEELVLAVRGGELEAFDDLYRRYAGRLYGYLLRASAAEADRAEDLVHDVFLRVLKDRSFDPRRGRFSAWLFTVARNRVFEGHRRERSRPELVAELHEEGSARPSLGPAVDELVDRRRKVHAAMAELSEAHRQVLLLKQVGGLTYAEIGEALGVAEGTIKSRLHAAVRAFREQMLRLQSESITEGGELLELAALKKAKGEAR